MKPTEKHTGSPRQRERYHQKVLLVVPFAVFKMNGMGAKISEIKSLDEWENMMKESAASDPIVVLDVYIDWAGPCSVMQFFFDRLVYSSCVQRQVSSIFRHLQAYIPSPTPNTHALSFSF